MSRNHRAKLGNETVDIVQRGWYETSGGDRVDISASVAKCLADTRLYTPEDLQRLLDCLPLRKSSTVFNVANETTLSAAQRLVVEQGQASTLCLNFASAKNPGGGFLKGSQAQEESLARSSALHASLLTQATYYDQNRKCGTALYTDHMILSPNVPVFRNDDGSLLSAPYSVSMATCPAVNAGAMAKNEPERAPSGGPVMASRIAKLLGLAAAVGYEHLVLGAWGCGVFGNVPSHIARLFGDALLIDRRFAKQFASVNFAVLDGTDDERILCPFRMRFLRKEAQ